MKTIAIKLIAFPLEISFGLVLAILAIVARFIPKKIDVGLGPLPLINNIYHKKVFQECGYSAETFVNQVWHITSDFDIRGDLHLFSRVPLLKRGYTYFYLMVLSLLRYRCVLIYFNGGPLGVPNTLFLWRLEPLFYKIAKVKTLLLAYGADVQAMSLSRNLLFKNAQSEDYPLHKNSHERILDKIDLWTRHGSHIVGGCEWVDYMHHWDSLMISHFSIDVDALDKIERPMVKRDGARGMKILHAPNHRAIKGTEHVVRAVRELNNEGYNIDLVLVEKKPNEEIKRLILECDVVIDQLIVGWYAMFAIEAMGLRKPVVCYYRQDLEELYRAAGLYSDKEHIPLINSSALDVKDTLKRLYDDMQDLEKIGEEGYQYVRRHHSIEAISQQFGPIMKKLIGEPQADSYTKA